MAKFNCLRFCITLAVLGAISGQDNAEVADNVADESFSRSQVRRWSPTKVREVVGQLAETVEDLGKKLLEMPIEGPSGAPGPPGPRGLPVRFVLNKASSLKRHCCHFLLCRDNLGQPARLVLQEMKDPR